MEAEVFMEVAGSMVAADFMEVVLPGTEADFTAERGTGAVFTGATTAITDTGMGTDTVMAAR